VSPEVADEIWRRRGEIVLAGQEKIATVVFSDIRSFTKITAGKSSAEVLQWLNDYFTAMAAIVHEEGGFLNKFIGDGLMAVFGVPVSHGEKEDACRAVRAAVRMKGISCVWQVPLLGSNLCESESNLLKGSKNTL
jgi:adenylate cyclase